MTLSLLRGPTVPDADQDQGEHTFAFASKITFGTAFFIISDLSHPFSTTSPWIILRKRYPCYRSTFQFSSTYSKNSSKLDTIA